MIELLGLEDYEKSIASTRDSRMSWWRSAKFGMFVHYGLYSVRGMHEWQMAYENIPVSEYERLADRFSPRPGAPREWARLAVAAGMKYMVLTTRHHEGFSLWDSDANPFNAVNYGPHRDIVREFVDACREFGLKIGFYSSLMDWHNPDSRQCIRDPEARKRFTDYIEALNTELLTRYGKIDILWYDVPEPLRTWEEWDSLARNQRLRALQPDIIINDRSRLPEDFGTPEGEIRAQNRDWEACMTYNDLSWGYVDSTQASAYGYNAQRILRMLYTVAGGGGNLLLNIGPAPDASVPAEATAPLTAVGHWLKHNGEAFYCRSGGGASVNGVTSGVLCGNTVYGWNWIWPSDGEMSVGGLRAPLKSVTLLDGGAPLAFEQIGDRIFLRNLPEKSPDPVAGVTVLKLEFEHTPELCFASSLPQLHGGKEI